MTGKNYLKTYKRVMKRNNHVKIWMLQTGETEKAYSFKRFKGQRNETWIPKSVCIRVKNKKLEEEIWTEMAIEKWFYKQEKTSINQAIYQSK